MNSDRRHFLDGSKSPRKPLTEAKMIKYPADLEHKNHRDMTPAEKQRWIAYHRAYNQAVSNQDFSGIETSPSLGTKSKEYQDAWKAWNRQRTMHAANRDFHLIKPFVAPKEKTKKEEVTTEAKTLLVEYQTPEREQMQMKELQRLQTIARAKAKAWDTRSGNPKSQAQEAAFDAAVDKLSAEVRDAENERRWEKVIDKDGKDKRPSAALLKQLAPQRAAQLKRDAEDNAGAWVGTAQFDRDSNKASIIIDEIKKGLSKSKTTKKESVTTKGYTELLESVLLALCEELELDPNELLEDELLEDYQTPERADQTDRLRMRTRKAAQAAARKYDQAKVLAQHEKESPKTYGSKGRVVKPTKKMLKNRGASEKGQETKRVNADNENLRQARAWARKHMVQNEEVTTKGYTELLEVALITLCNKYELDLKTLLVELQTPERSEELDRLYFKAEDKFMRNIGSDALMNALNAIDKKNYTEIASKSTYGKGGKIVKRAK